MLTSIVLFFASLLSLAYITGFVKSFKIPEEDGDADYSPLYAIIGLLLWGLFLLSNTLKINEMNKEIKEKWIAALKSGEYEQGKNYLRTSDNKFCCLGVLEDIHLKELGKEWETNSEGGYHIDGNTAYLTKETQKWAGLERDNPYPKECNRSLAVLNDEGQTFEEIADFIEKGL